MRFVVVFLSLQWIGLIFSQLCQNLPDLPVYINSDYDSTRSIKGCINNSSFLTNEVVEMLRIDCDAESLEAVEELPRNFISNLPNLTEIIVTCSVKSIQPGAFSHLPLVTDMDLSNNELTNITSGVFKTLPNLLYLYLSGNAIAFIENRAFSNMTRLIVLDLSYNRLKKLHRAWFENTTSIEEFIVNGNFLEEIPEGMFRGWEACYAYNFDYNEIRTIHDGAFKDASLNINYLSLHNHNQLKSINLRAFPDRDTTILQVDLSSNLLNYIPANFFKRIKMIYIWIYGNPFECTCLNNIEKALEEPKLVNIELKVPRDARCGNGSNIPVCLTSSDSSEVCTETVNTELSDRMTICMKKLGFVDLKGWHEECTVISKRELLF